MAITGMQLRCSTQETKALTYTVPSGGCVGGEMVKINDTVGVFAETKDAGEDVAVIFSAHKILLPKVAAGGQAITQGGKIYFVAATKNVTVTAQGNTLCGRALVAAGDNATTVLAVLNGDVVA